MTAVRADRFMRTTATRLTVMLHLTSNLSKASYRMRCPRAITRGGSAEIPCARRATGKTCAAGYYLPIWSSIFLGLVREAVARAG